MNKYSIAALCLALLLLAGCTTDSTSLPAESAKSTSEVSSMAETASEAASETAAPERPEDNTYMLTCPVYTIGGYHTLNASGSTEQIRLEITLPDPWYVEYGIIYSSARTSEHGTDLKVGELVVAAGLREGEAFEDLYYTEDGTDEFSVQLEQGALQDAAGREILYDITESHYNGRTYIYSFLIPVEDTTAAWLVFYNWDDYNEEDFLPYFEVAQTVQLWGI